MGVKRVKDGWWRFEMGVFGGCVGYNSMPRGGVHIVRYENGWGYGRRCTGLMGVED